MIKPILEKKRAQVRELFFKKHLKKSTIAKKLLASRIFVRKWIAEKDITKDSRGWPKGLQRKYTKKEFQRVKGVRKECEENGNYYYGPIEVQRVYLQKYPKERKPSLDFIKYVIKESGRARPYRKEKKKGGAKRKHYPARLISSLGKVIEEIDFIGPKQLEGSSIVFSFLSQSYKQPFKYNYIDRISAQQSQETAIRLIENWKEHPLPDVLKIDQDFAFIAKGRRGRKRIGKFIRFLLNLNIIPVFSAPGKSWNNALVEGDNGVFTKKVWKIKYKTLREVDQSIERFNKEHFEFRKFKEGFNLNGYKRLSKNFKFSENPFKKLKVRKSKLQSIYFICLVEEMENNPDKGTIEIFKEKILLNKSYINQFVLAEVKLSSDELKIYYEEEDGKARLISKRKFSMIL